MVKMFVINKEYIKTVKDVIGDYHTFKPISTNHVDLSSFQHSTAKLSDLNLKRIKITPHNGGDRRSWPEDLKLDRNSVGMIIPFPGTELFDQCVRDDLFVDKIDFDMLWNTPIWAFKYSDSDAPESEFLIKPYNMELADLVKWREKFIEVRYKYFGYFHEEFKQPKRFWVTDTNQLQDNHPELSDRAS